MLLTVDSPLDEWLSYIEKLHYNTIDMSLDRIYQVAKRLDVLKPAPFIFHVTGTNGKSTTCHILEKILIASGYKVGVYISPHLIHYIERIRIQNSELPEIKHKYSFTKIENVRDNISLTYFEYSTLSALWLFKEEKLDVVILEVGLGGRLDATNIVNTDISIITNIAVDHTDWLGSNRESIGREKAGIFRAGKPAIIGEKNIPDIILQIARKHNIELFRRDVEWYFQVNSNKNVWNYGDKLGELINLPLPYVSLSNVAIALAAMRVSSLFIEQKAIYHNIQNVILPGRFQVINYSPRLIIDVAHNPHAALHLVKKLKLMPKTGRILAVIAMLHDKDIQGMLSCMKDIVDNWYCASLYCPRGASAEQIMRYLSNKSKAYNTVDQAVHKAMSDANLEDTVLVCGSFYTAAHVIKNINI